MVVERFLPDGRRDLSFGVGGQTSFGVSDALNVADALVASAETVVPTAGPLRGAPPEETGVVLRWLDQPGTRLVYADVPWSSPAGAAAAWVPWAEQAAGARPLRDWN